MFGQIWYAMNPMVPLKKKIIPVPAVNAAIMKDGKVLLTRRSQQIREPGKWCLPGGHLEKGETWATAIEREILEEVGIQITRYQLMGIYSDPAVTVTPNPVANGYHVQFLVALFRVTEFKGEIAPNFEVDAWEWVTPDKIPQPILQSHPIRVKDACEFKGGVFVR